MESAAVWNLKRERWGSQLVEEEKWQGEKACDKRQNNNNNNNDNNNNNELFCRYVNNWNIFWCFTRSFHAD